MHWNNSKDDISRHANGTINQSIIVQSIRSIHPIHQSIEGRRDIMKQRDEKIPRSILFFFIYSYNTHSHNHTFTISHNQSHSHSLTWKNLIRFSRFLECICFYFTPLVSIRMEGHGHFPISIFYFILCCISIHVRPYSTYVRTYVEKEDDDDEMCTYKNIYIHIVACCGWERTNERTMADAVMFDTSLVPYMNMNMNARNYVRTDVFSKPCRNLERHSLCFKVCSVR